MDKSFEYDEIGPWSEAKLDIIREYAHNYTTILSKQPFIKKFIYIDAFAGAGTHISKDTGKFVKGSPLNAIDVTPPFSEIHLIDLDSSKTAELRRQSNTYNNVSVYTGDANKVLLDQIFPRCRYENYARALCFLDPYALDVDWNVVQTAGQLGTVEIFYNFMIMDANMNVFWKDPQKVASAQLERMDKLWGDRTWKEKIYVEKPALFGDSGYIKKKNEDIVEAFRRRLKEVAGFKFVPRPIPMRTKKGAIIYYLFFASPKASGKDIAEYLFEKYRARGTA